jgi:hypothetical protein
MKKIFLLLLTISFISFAQQTEKSLIAITPYIRFDKYPGFSYAINSTSTTTIDKISGTSWGVNGVYKFPIYHRTYLNAGLGYYKYSFSKIDGRGNWGKVNERAINFPSPIYVIYYSDKYKYNCVSINIGIERWFNISKTLFFYGSAGLNDLYTFSQDYRITADYPTGPPNHQFNQHQKRSFGLSTDIVIGVEKTYHKIVIGPSIIIPVYDVWHKDHFFPSEVPGISENPSSLRSKWFNGIGAGISLAYELK